MKQLLFLPVLFWCLAVGAQNETSKASSIDKVTVFFQGAQVARSFKTTLTAGRQFVVFEKLTNFLDPNSIQVKATGDLTILSVGSRKNFEDLKMSNSEVTELRSEKVELEREETRLADEYSILGFDKNLLLVNRDLRGNNGLSVNELKQAYAFMHEELSKITNRQSEIQDRFEEISKAINHIDQEIISQRSRPVINYSEVVIEIDVHNSTSAEFFTNYISPNASWKPYYDMRSDGIGQPVNLEAKAFVHQTTGIDWDNVNLVLSTNDPYQSTIEPILSPWYINYNNQPQQVHHQASTVPTFNYVGQKIRGEVIDAETGEPMPFARLTFNNSSQVGCITDVDGMFEVIVPKSGTYLSASFIGYENSQLPVNASYMKFFLSAKAIVINGSNSRISREDIALTPARINTEVMSIDGISVRGARSNRRRLFGKKVKNASDVSNASVNNATTVQATVVQKALRVEYIIESEFSIPSDGLDQRVSISKHQLPAEYEYHSAPKLEESVYLVARVSGWEKLNLLNGESNLYFDGTYIGKTHVDANSLRDTLTFSLGKDSKIQIDRKRIVANSSNRVFGLRRKFEVQWEINVRNNGGASIPIVIKDQFPISQNADIKIKIGDYLGAKIDGKTKIITWENKLSIGTSKTFTFDYKVDHHRKYLLYLE